MSAGAHTYIKLGIITTYNEINLGEIRNIGLYIHAILFAKYKNQ